jgi:pilus assembly protein CpaB
MDRLRQEALRNVISMVEDRNFGGLRNSIQANRRGVGIPKSRLMLLVVAIVAGGLAAYLTMQQPSAPAPVVEPKVVEAPMAKILVAKDLIPAGEHLKPDSLQWMDWPEAALQPEYITATATPDATTTMGDQVARSAIYPGEPIREAKLTTGGTGYLSALLDPGTRAVSVQIQAASSSGGFIVPNDRVDVVLTRSTPGSGNQDSETLLRNVKVLAINDRLGDSPPASDSESGDEKATKGFSSQAIATLALDPTQAKVIINSTGMGALSLMLRPAADAVAANDATENSVNASIRLSSPFWTTPQTGATLRQ